MRGNLKCQCCGAYQITDELATAIKALEMEVGELIVTSLFRCPLRNSAVNGALHSFHTKGMAVDFLCKKEDQPLVICMMKKIGFGGIGVGPHWLHGDVGPVRTPWGYGPDGKSMCLVS